MGCFPTDYHFKFISNYWKRIPIVAAMIALSAKLFPPGRVGLELNDGRAFGKLIG